LVQSVDDMSLAQFWLHCYLRHPTLRPVPYSDRALHDRQHDDWRYRIVPHEHQEADSEDDDRIAATIPSFTS
jgi:hypothetical protein